QNDDGADHQQFRFQIFFNNTRTYILVVTTFSIISAGPASVQFIIQSR
ncbi:unnamed protein product, partial [Rotaria socialis]